MTNNPNIAVSNCKDKSLFSVCNTSKPISSHNCLLLLATITKKNICVHTKHVFKKETLKHHFGDLPAIVTDKVKNGTLEQIQTWSMNILDSKQYTMELHATETHKLLSYI